MPVMTSKRPPVLQPTVQSPPRRVEETPRTTSTPNLGVTVDTRYNPANSMLQYVSGTNWSVRYFSQVVGRHDDTMAQNTDLAAPYQQYIRINEMELKVQSALSTSQDSQTKEMEITGSAVMYPGVIPNKGDMFVADLEDGQYGHFVVTGTEKKSLMKDSVYQIEYVMKGYLDSHKLADLEKKVVRETYWVKDYLKFGQNPQVLAPDYYDLVELRDEYRRLVSAYWADFYSEDCKTLIIPDQPEPVYDPFIVAALLDWVDTEDHPLVKATRRFHTKSRYIMRNSTLWNALSRMEDALMIRAIQFVELTPTIAWLANPDLGGLYYGKVRYCVTPVDGRTDGDRGHNVSFDPIPEKGLLVNGQRRWFDLNRQVMETELKGLYYEDPAEPNLPWIVPVMADSYYVFTEGFYAREPKFSSKLERLTYQCLRGETPDTYVLSQLVKKSHHWSSLERFYYQAVLIGILKAWLRTN